MLQSSADKACNVLVKKVCYLKDVRKITKMMNGKLIYSWLKWQCGEFFSLNYKLTKRIYSITFIYNKG
ncbi:TPA: hypothetical protein ACQZE1_001010 [Escherichia coli]|uniref:hypothetical protein n=1 Tax=Escherichia coli TaxID=562 RepID=UPI0017E05F32|nr:hypothetical protein [Escherichia coli]EHW7699875.1 hypothetical protein [Escherichia coli]EIW6475904.1 hypothetical protein [Escherichia coli]EJU9706823.1 hypothetical protein [Escherichia coli]MCQ0420333.1 hypothetical protein [Escherichia coli]MCV2970340.1 hypothetical protein [Escherichia coli]